MMRSEFIPTVTIQIDRMKSCISNMLGIHGSELEDVINKQIDRALSNLDFSEMIEEVIREEVYASLKHFFTVGDGKEAIRQSISLLNSKGGE
jgi:hypothetical protein